MLKLCQYWSNLIKIVFIIGRISSSDFISDIVIRVEKPNCLSLVYTKLKQYVDLGWKCQLIKFDQYRHNFTIFLIKLYQILFKCQLKVENVIKNVESIKNGRKLLKFIENVEI